MLRNGLAKLTAPTSTEEFFKSFWPQEPFVTHGLNESIQELRELPFLQSLDEILKIWTRSVQVHLPDVADESSSIDANPADAKKLFNNGMGLLFNQVHALSPVLERWLMEIADELGLPASTYSRCMVYATPDGKGTAPHFDQNINFVLQLQGTKKWWLAPNESIENPTERFTIGQSVDPELQIYHRGEFPDQMPEPRQEIILKPGSMLFVPRGFWHSTEAEGEALALNFTFSQPTWVDLLTSALRSRLLLSPDWRDLADGVRSKDKDRRLLAEQKFDALLMELIEDLPNWNAHDILHATEGEH